MRGNKLSVCLGLVTTLATGLVLSPVISSDSAMAESAPALAEETTQVTSDSEKLPEVFQLTNQESLNKGQKSDESTVEEATEEKTTRIPENLIEAVAQNQKAQASALQQNNNQSGLAQNTLPPAPIREEIENIEKIENQLEDLENRKFPIRSTRPGASPGVTISNPHGFGADGNTVFLVAGYQARTRFTNVSDGGVGLGVALGNARKAVGVELSYTQASFGTNGNAGGGFSAKVHRRIDQDSSVAVGWNLFARVESRLNALDYPKNSYYASYTRVFRTREFIEQPFSRIAVTAGVGSGQFLSESRLRDAVAKGQNPSGLNVFGSVAVRVVEPVSAIVEWTGQDLAAGLSIVPFKNLPIVITPAFRDITGAGDGARFVLGTGVSFKL